MLLLGSLCSPGPAGAANGVVFDVDAWGYSEPLAIDDYVHDWLGSLDSGTDGFLYERHRIGGKWGQFEIARVSQQIYEVRPNRDFVRLYKRLKNQTPSIAGERFDVDLDVRHARMRGAQFVWTADLKPGLILRPSVNVWDAADLAQGSFGGTVDALGGQDYDYDFDIDYRYTEDELLDRRVSPDHGRGASLDLAASYQISDSWRLAMDVHDLIGVIWWEDAPFTEARATSQNTDVDENGFVVFDPTVSGVEGFRNYRQRLPVRGVVSATRTVGEFSLEGRLRANELRAFPELAFSWQPHEGTSLGAGLVPIEKAVELKARWRGLALTLASDALDYKKAHFLRLGLAAHLVF